MATPQNRGQFIPFWEVWRDGERVRLRHQGQGGIGPPVEASSGERIEASDLTARSSPPKNSARSTAAAIATKPPPASTTGR